MKFLNPNGLWLLLGVPILIIIYLIKSRHEEHSVSSTYLWKLSRRFMKKRLPLQRLRRIMLFLLQLCIIILAALMAAKPVVIGSESHDYIVILDASAGMQTKNDKGQSRFERALDKVEDLARDLSGSDTLSVILASDSATLLVQNATSASEVALSLQRAECTKGGLDLEQAMTLAQQVCDRSENAKVLFYTDAAHEEGGNVEIVDFSCEEWNVSVWDMVAKRESEGMTFSAAITSTHRDVTVAVGLRVDGKTIDVAFAECTNDKPQKVSFFVEKLTYFERAEVYVEEKDALQDDNAFALCQPSQKKHTVLLASASPLYLESALTALGNCQVNVVTSLTDVVLAGYDLCIFDGLYPEAYPADCAVIVFGAQKLPLGLTSVAQYETENKLGFNRKLESELYDGLSLAKTVVKRYSSLVGGSSWQNVLYCNSAVVLATSKQENGMQFSVFSFDLHDSNLPLQADFLVLLKNLIKFSVPAPIKETDYTVGDTVALQVLPFTEQLYLRYPDESVTQLYIAGDVISHTAKDVGIYTVVCQAGEGGDYADFYVHIPKEESFPEAGGALNLAITQKENTNREKNYHSIWFWFALAMLLLALIEWEWYYYEQY